MRSRLLFLILIAVVFTGGIAAIHRVNRPDKYEIGQVVDSLNGVFVYYNGSVGHVSGRNLTADNYNLGLKYQCVEFVKRYYYEYLDHKMPDSYGHAVDFFDNKTIDGELNKRRNLVQYKNPSSIPPAPDDLVVFNGNAFNPYGHVAIISRVTEDQIEIVQQNPGPYAPSRIMISLVSENGKWRITDSSILGWLRKK